MSEWSQFHQEVENALARLMVHYDVTVRANGSDIMLCEYLAPRVAAAITAADTEALLDNPEHQAIVLQALRGSRAAPPTVTRVEVIDHELLEAERALRVGVCAPEGEGLNP